jgi:hypothetical protein
MTRNWKGGDRCKVDRINRFGDSRIGIHIPGMILELSDDQAALAKELAAIIDGDHCFLSPRIQTLREIRNMIRPEPKREPLPERKALGGTLPQSSMLTAEPKPCPTQR